MRKIPFGCFEMPGKAGSVEERGGQGLPAQRMPQGGQTPQICRVQYGFRHIVVIIFGDPVSKSRVMGNAFSYMRKKRTPRRTIAGTPP
jgi:hypothetical protein